MAIVKINVIEVPEGRGEVLEQRFAARAGEVETVDGFESFDLLRPTEGTDRYLVVTRWRDEDAFQAWMNSAAFQRGHAQSASAPPADHGASAASAPADQPDGGSGGHAHAGGHPGGEAADRGGHPGGEAADAGGQPGASHAGGQGPAAVGSELWGFEIVTSATGQQR